MYFVKDKVCGTEVSIDLHAGNVFTTCPSCGKEFPIDLGEMVELFDGVLDLYGTAVYCEECSAARKERR